MVEVIEDERQCYLLVDECLLEGIDEGQVVGEERGILQALEQRREVPRTWRAHRREEVRSQPPRVAIRRVEGQPDDRSLRPGIGQP